MFEIVLGRSVRAWHLVTSCWVPRSSGRLAQAAGASETEEALERISERTGEHTVDPLVWHVGKEIFDGMTDSAQVPERIGDKTLHVMKEIS